MAPKTRAVSDSTVTKRGDETACQLPLDALSAAIGSTLCSVMFDIGVCEAQQVVLIRFSGELTESDFARLDRMAADARGRVEFDCIFDFTAVERVDLATEFVAKRGELPQAFKNRERSMWSLRMT